MNITKKRLSIKWHIFSYLIGFCALLLIVLWLFQTVLLDAFYKNVKIAEIKNSADQIAHSIDDETTLIFNLQTISQRNEYLIQIISPKGDEILSFGDTKNKMPLSEKTNLLSQLKNKDEYVEYLSNDLFRNNEFQFIPSPKNKAPIQSIIYLKKINNDKIIFINAMITPVDATVITLRYQLYFITGIMLILSILLALIISKRVSKPIEKLNISAKVLAKGNYNVTFPDYGYKEVGELSDTLNMAASELNKVDSLRRELMANISHDLRTPLSLIYGYAEIMHDFPQEITEEQTQTIMDETQRLSSLVNDVLDISKLESGIEQLNICQFNFTQSIKITTERIFELIKKMGYNLTFSYDKEVILKADEIKITQAFYNLLINAVNYTGNDKTILVRQVISDDNVKVEVIDSGEGITEENIPFIWDRYFKADKNHKRPITGTGLGLSIVKKVIELHNGSYGVTSKIGAGSNFWFSLKIKS